MGKNIVEKTDDLQYLRKNTIKNCKCKKDAPFAFISYAHDDADIEKVRKIFNGLWSKGYNVWIDVANLSRRSAGAWFDSCYSAIQRSKIVLFFRSEESLIRDTVYKELDLKKRQEEEDFNIVTIDIWHDKMMNAEKYLGEKLREGGKNSTICKKICEIVSPEANAIRLREEANNRIEEIVEMIIEELEDVGITSVFGKDTSEEAPEEVHKIAAKTQKTVPLSLVNTNSLVEMMSLSELNKKKITRAEISKISLIGKGIYEKYSIRDKESTIDLCTGFIQLNIDIYGESYLKFVNEKTRKGKKKTDVKPFFATQQEYEAFPEEKTRKLYRKRKDFDGRWYMYVRYSSSSWVEQLIKRIQELEEFHRLTGLPDISLDDFEIELIRDEGREAARLQNYSDTSKGKQEIDIEDDIPNKPNRLK